MDWPSFIIGVFIIGVGVGWGIAQLVILALPRNPIPTDLVYADIRAALERVEELEEANAVIPELMRFKWNDEQIRIATERAEAAEAEVERLRTAAQAHLDAIGHADGDPCDVGFGCTMCGLSAALAPEVKS